MTLESDLHELSLNDPLLQMSGGGEVGATGMGDNLHYTGKESWNDCMINEMTGRGGQKGFFDSFWICTF